MSLYYLLAVLFVFVRRSHAGHPGYSLNARPGFAVTSYYESTTFGPAPPGMNVPTLVTPMPGPTPPSQVAGPPPVAFSAPIVAQIRDHPHVVYHTKYSHIYSPRSEVHNVVHSYTKESFSNTNMVLRSNDVTSFLNRILPPDDFFDNITRNLFSAAAWRDRFRRRKLSSARAVQRAFERKNS